MNIIEEIGHAKVIGITGHIRPDGDCVGSTLGYIIISGRIFLSARLLFILKSRQMNLIIYLVLMILSMRPRISILIYS